MMKTEVHLFPITFLPLGELYAVKGSIVHSLTLSLSLGLIFYVFAVSSGRLSKNANISNSFKINEFVSRYELVDIHAEEYSNASRWATHIRVESSRIDFSVLVEFRAFNTTFCAHLYQGFAGDATVFPSHVPITSISSHGKKTVYRNDLRIIFFKGYLIDKPISSFVHGTVQSGKFDFVIKLPNENYYVEPSRKYSNLNLKTDNSFIVYKGSDVRQFSHESELDDCFKIPRADESQLKPKVYQSHYKRHRNKRLVKNPMRTCSLCVVVDHTFFKEVGQFTVEKTMAEVVHSIQEADLLFRLTDFDNDTEADNIGFAISDVRIYETVTAPNYLLRQVNLDSAPLLVQLSKYDFDDFCLGLLFTFRDFSDGVIGLAWTSGVGDNTVTGGICHKRIYTSPGDNIPVHLYNFNTLVITQLSHGQYIHRSIVAMTTTHELGHAFGAYHDDVDDACLSVQQKIYGNYLMFSKTTRSDHFLRNNYRFSKCSKAAISATVMYWNSCFNSFPFPVCGNMILELGEECDCGVAAQCLATDPCCKPPSITNRTERSGCTYYAERGSVCSPQTDLCCTSECQIASADRTVVCREATDCTEESICNGMSSSCPIPRLKPMYSPCANGMGYCDGGGVCGVSVCVMSGLVDCQCTFTFRAMCKPCCRCSIQSSICLPSEWLGLSYFTTNTKKTLITGDNSVYVLPGSKCNGNTGVCNANNICIKNH